MSASSPAPDQGGFTLLEVLIALAILGTAVVLSIQGVSQGLRLLKVSGDQQQALIVADQKARELVVPTESTESGTAGRFGWQRTTRVLETPELTPPDAAPEWRVFEISVVVTWDEQRRLELATLRTVPATSDPTRAAEPFGSQAGSGSSSGTASSPTTSSTTGTSMGAGPSSAGSSSRTGSPSSTGSSSTTGSSSSTGSSSRGGSPFGPGRSSPGRTP